MTITTIKGRTIEATHAHLLRRLDSQQSPDWETKITDLGGDKMVKFGSLAGSDMLRPARVEWYLCTLLSAHGVRSCTIVDLSEAHKIVANGKRRAVAIGCDIWIDYADTGERASWSRIDDDEGCTPPVGLTDGDDLSLALQPIKIREKMLDTATVELMRTTLRPADETNIFGASNPQETEAEMMESKLQSARQIDRLRKINAWANDMSTVLIWLRK